MPDSQQFEVSTWADAEVTHAEPQDAVYDGADEEDDESASDVKPDNDSDRGSK